MRTTARMTAFKPGQSPPPVRTPTRMPTTLVGERRYATDAARAEVKLGLVSGQAVPLSPCSAWLPGVLLRRHRRPGKQGGVWRTRQTRARPTPQTGINMRACHHRFPAPSRSSTPAVRWACCCATASRAARRRCARGRIPGPAGLHGQPAPAARARHDLAGPGPYGLAGLVARWTGRSARWRADASRPSSSGSRWAAASRCAWPRSTAARCAASWWSTRRWPRTPSCSCSLRR